MASGGNLIASLLGRFGSKLRYPQLFFATAALFLIDLVVPDLFPFVDEILLGLLTLILANMTEAKGGTDDVRQRPVKDVTPREPDMPPHPGEERTTRD